MRSDVGPAEPQDGVGEATSDQATIMQTLARHVGLRVLLYGLGIAAVAYTVRLPGALDPTGSYYAEWSPVEWVQLGLLVMATVMMCWAGTVDPVKRPVAVLLALALLAVVLRELHSPGHMGPLRYLWKLGAPVLMVAMGVYAHRRREDLRASLRDLVALPTLPMVITGAMIVVIFSQVMGRTDHWMALLGDDYIRTMRNVAEEGSEVLGYLVVMVGAVEYVVAAYRRVARDGDDG